MQWAPDSRFSSGSQFYGMGPVPFMSTCVFTSNWLMLVKQISPYIRSSDCLLRTSLVLQQQSQTYAPGVPLFDHAIKAGKTKNNIRRAVLGCTRDNAYYRSTCDEAIHILWKLLFILCSMSFLIKCILRNSFMHSNRTRGRTRSTDN